ncbi:MAG: DegV family protein [Thermoanaerobaculales bacterium]
MARPTVLVVDTQEQQRRELANGLAGFGYEVITAADGDEGKRFVTGLDPNVIVVEAALREVVCPAALTQSAAPGSEKQPPVCVVLGVQETPAEDEAEPGLSFATAGLSSTEILRKLRTVLVGREVGLEASARLDSLVGDFQAIPLFELLPALERAVVTGHLLVGAADLALLEGTVIAARTGKAQGLKAFCRVARQAEGSFRLVLGPIEAEREIDLDLLSLMAAAMEDKHRFAEAGAALPDFASSLRLVMGPAFFATQFTPSQQMVLGGTHDNATVWNVLDVVAVPDGTAVQEIAQLHRLGFVEFSEPEARVRVVTDSTCDLPREVALRNRIHVVPLSVIVGEAIYKDGVDLSPGAFYKLLQSKRQPYPRTSPPTMGEFLTSYRLMAGRTDIVSLHISEKMSQTVVNARAAAEDGRDEFQRSRKDGVVAVEVLDSGQVSIGLAVMAVLASRLAQRRLSAAEIRSRLEQMRPRFHLLFVVDTLDYLARDGRIGKARAAFGGLFGIKPILGVVDGEVAPIDKVRGGKAAHPRLVELFKKRVDASKPVIVGVGHASAPVWADRLRTILTENFKISEIVDVEIGPVVGAHVGAGCVGAVMFQPSAEEMSLIAPPTPAS